MEHHIYFEDYEIGTTRTTFGRTITETDFVVHAGHTGDFFPHHMDAEFMKTQPFGQRIAHGTMVFAIGVGLTASRINPVAFSYGYDKLRFIKPVFIRNVRSMDGSGNLPRCLTSARKSYLPASTSTSFSAGMPRRAIASPETLADTRELLCHHNDDFGVGAPGVLSRDPP
jgi:hypothetical protein